MSALLDEPILESLMIPFAMVVILGSLVANTDFDIELAQRNAWAEHCDCGR